MLPFAINAGDNAPLRVLCLGAHSDDIELGCGGTILRLVSEHPKCIVHWVVFASNPQRETEARASAAEFLANAGESFVSVKGFRESYFPYVGAEIKDYFEELKVSRPDIILSHHRHDVHQDHRLIAELTWNTFRNHLILEYEIPKYEGDLGNPNLYVPLTRSVAQQKVALLMRHFSTQRSRAWFRTEVFEGLLSVRGIECNATEGKAEAFHLRKALL
jgi:LmbE family N-acetylglucosaminyl deacetylase